MEILCVYLMVVFFLREYPFDAGDAFLLSALALTALAYKITELDSLYARASGKTSGFSTGSLAITRIMKSHFSDLESPVPAGDLCDTVECSREHCSELSGARLLSGPARYACSI